jgi:hypothetical protein
MSNASPVTESGVSNEKSAFLRKAERLQDFWYSHGPQTLLYALPVLITISSSITVSVTTSATINNSWAFFSGTPLGALGVLFVWAIYKDIKTKERYSDIVDDNERLRKKINGIEKDLSHYTEGYILSLANVLEFGKQKSNTDRITLYHHDNDGEFFIPVERFSYNTRYTKKGRSTYPDDEGCIAKAWQHGEYFENDLPLFENNPQQYVERQHKQHGLDKDVAQGLTMKSRLYYGWQIRSVNGNQPLAVIIVESTEPDRWTENELSVFFRKRKRELCEFIDRFKQHLPEISAASKRGL